MAVIIDEICLYSNTPPSEKPTCPWRTYLNSLQYYWRDLAYYDAEGAQSTVDALSTWVSADRRLYVTDFPFVMYKKYDTEAKGQPPLIIIHKTLNDLKADTDLINV